MSEKETDQAVAKTEEEANPPKVEKPAEKDSESKGPYAHMPKTKYFDAFEEALGDQSGKVVVITGTTSGTGKIAAKTTLKKGATCVMLNRNEEKARKALEGFFAEHPGTEERARYVHCDLQSFESVENAAKEVTEMFKDQGIDVLSNNAGVMALEDKATADGYDVQMQTNHLSHFLLTKLLFPLLTKRAEEVGEARVVNHSSGARLLPPTPLKAKYFQKKGGQLGGNGNNMMFGARWQRYHQTKLANSVFTCELQKRCDKANSKVIALCAHPGLAATELQATTQKEGGLKSTGFMKNSQSQEDGAMGLVKCMFDTNLVKGALYGPMFATGKASHRYHGMFTTSSAGKTLWKESEAACGEFTI